jgi:crotonobetainyl-CoA:carnitine CoA-transferase CaiB-like acyl-CoA transferase
MVKRLIADADIVIDNYSAGVLRKLGLDHDTLEKLNPRLVMLSMPAFGIDGPWRETRAYGSTLEQASGMPRVVGLPEDPPTLTHIAYGDPIGGLHAASALLVALYHSKRTGRGQRIVLSQVECMLTMTAPWIIEQSAQGKVAPRDGRGHPAHAPHGCYPCAGEDCWLLVAVASDAQWLDLCHVIGRDDLGTNAALRTAHGRRQSGSEIDQAISAWTAVRSADEAMLALQKYGVPAGVSRAPSDLLEDPHLKARGFWQWIDRAYVGLHPQPSPPYRFDSQPLPKVLPSPTLGEFNYQVLEELLGLSQAEIRGLEELGIIGTTAVPPDKRKSRASTGAASANLPLHPAPFTT